MKTSCVAAARRGAALTARTQSVAEFGELAVREPQRHAELRRRAKAINFGIPGGEGVDTLRDYVASQYSIVLTRDEAAAYRSRVIYTIYPELGAYLREDALQLLAHGLGAAVRRRRRC